jgi:hypothetical protein
MGGLGPAPTIEQAELEEEEEEDQEEVVLMGEEGRSAAAAGDEVPEVPQAGPSRGRTATRSQPKTRVKKVDDMMFEVMERLRDRPTDARLAAATDSRIMWGQWVGREMNNLGRGQWMKFTAEVQGLMAKYQDQQQLLDGQGPQQQQQFGYHPPDAPPAAVVIPNPQNPSTFRPLGPHPQQHQYQQPQQHHHQPQQHQPLNPQQLNLQQNVPSQYHQSESFVQMMDLTSNPTPYDSLTGPQQQQRERQLGHMVYGPVNQPSSSAGTRAPSGSRSHQPDPLNFSAMSFNTDLLGSPATQNTSNTSMHTPRHQVHSPSGVTSTRTSAGTSAGSPTIAPTIVCITKNKSPTKSPSKE